MRRGAAALAALLALLPAPGRAETVVTNAELGFTLAVPDGWRPFAVSAADVVQAYRNEAGDQVAVVSRSNVGRRVLGAGPELAVTLERGVARDTAGYRRTARDQRAFGNTQVVDLAYRREAVSGLTTVEIRFLVLSGRTVALTCASRAAPSRTARRAARRLRDSFRPLP